ncbi:hypothetical protein [Pseudomonas abietaniphila]
MIQKLLFDEVLMLGFIELDLRERLRAPGAIPYARRQKTGRYILEIAASEGVYVLQRQRGGVREFRTFEALLKLLAGEWILEFSVLLDDAEVNPAGSIAPWARFSPPSGTSYASSRHEFDIPF